MAVFFRIFRVFPLTFQKKKKKQVTEEIFRSSRPVFFCENWKTALGSNDLSTLPLKVHWHTIHFFAQLCFVEK